ncbi:MULTISPECIES: ATP-binding protein [Protofrankia]|uniref:ATP-binding region ATPase domain protein n=1 Tax=Candidatus Protofrankia datiscae TaxID=2716812 RepID=F8B154_9ACTN|nr:MULTISPECIES: ATP-binding protein [Protofrankia]AEH08790.1 ATP-binding region ATPase domain protein [Candidatus Protofrankia datiscae]
MAEALTARFDLPANARAAGRARRLVNELLSTWGREEDAEVARLLVSEVVTNAVRYTRSDDPLHVQVVAQKDRVRIAVGDGSSTHPVLRTVCDDDESGRGMHLVAALASEWGVDRSANDSPGKHVWFELAAPVHPRVPADAVRSPAFRIFR